MAGAFFRGRTPAGAHRPAEDAAAVALRRVAFPPSLAASSALRQTEGRLLDDGPFLQLDVDGILELRRGVNAHSIPSQHTSQPQGQEQAAELPPEGLVEVEVDERVVDVGAFGEEGGEHEALRSHVQVLLVENEEEGHHRVRRPGRHKTHADPEKHLEEAITGCRTLTLWMYFSAAREKQNALIMLSSNPKIY